VTIPAVWLPDSQDAHPLLTKRDINVNIVVSSKGSAIREPRIATSWSDRLAKFAAACRRAGLYCIFICT
jgi:hypothetical protein